MFLKIHSALNNRYASALLKKPVRLAWNVTAAPLRLLNNAVTQLGAAYMEPRRVTYYYEKKQMRRTISHVLEYSKFTSSKDIKRVAMLISAYFNVQEATMRYKKNASDDSTLDTLEKKVRYNPEINEVVKELIAEQVISPETLKSTISIPGNGLPESAIATRLLFKARSEFAKLQGHDPGDKKFNYLLQSGKQSAVETQRIYPVVFESYLKGGNSGLAYAALSIGVLSAATGFVAASVFSGGAVPAAIALTVGAAALGSWATGVYRNVVSGQHRVKGGVASEFNKFAKALEIEKQQERTERSFLNIK